MYARGNNVYGQQPYAAQSVYGKNLGSAYTGASLGGSDGGSQLQGGSRHTMLTGSQEADMGTYRAATSHYGGQYASVYGSTGLVGSQQSLGLKGVGANALENRGDYGRGDYMSSNIGYSHKTDQFSEKASDYSSTERHHFVGREFPNESTAHYANSTAFANQHKTVDQVSFLRKEELLKQQTSIDTGNRQVDYFAPRGAALRHASQDLASNYGVRMDVDSRSSAYGAQPSQSILGAAPRRGMDDLVYPQSNANSVYGVSLPPGRDYAVGKGILGASIEADAPPRGGLVRIDERKGDRVGYGLELELREDERRREQMREREKERERDERERELEKARAREREREREREHDREHERRREREREREREWERDRGRARERERMMELRERNRERSPVRIRDLHRSLSKDGRISRRDSPHHQSSHRRQPSVEEKRREYVCKVYSSRLNELERDFLAVDRRFPRLFISPELSKVVVHWPKGNLKLSIRTPVSFEHDFVGDCSVGKKDTSSVNIANIDENPLHRTVWNAKIILMSGLSKNSIEALSSEKVTDGRIPHICNILRFAVLKNEHSLMAIGGPWDATDGENPSVDSSSLIQTAQRHAKKVTNLDLHNCNNWNRFLEIHYDRAGEDGVFSHKEITVLFVPDLSGCVPSVDAWRTQWLQHKQDVANRDLAAKNRKSRDHKSKDREIIKGKENVSSKSSHKEEKKESKFSDKIVVDEKNSEIEPKSSAPVKVDVVTVVSEKDKNVVDAEDNGAIKEDAIEEISTDAVKTGKKKIIRRVVKRKASAQKNDIEASTVEDDKGTAKEAKLVGEKLTENSVVKEDGVNLEVEIEGSAAKSDISSGKQTVKKKIIKKVVKKKTPVAKKDVSDLKKEETSAGGTIKAEPEIVNLVDPGANAENKTVPLKKAEEKGNSSSVKPGLNVKKENAQSSVKVDADIVKEIKESGSLKKKEPEATKPADPEKPGKGSKSDQTKEKIEKSKEGKDEKLDQSKSSSETKEKQFGDPPKHPGLILQTKARRDSKLYSLSLSLDSLLGYSDKDVEESTFEVSLFAESLNEMLQYQMGCRLLSFLEKVRLKYSAKRNQRKKRQQEATDKTKEAAAVKRLKTSEETKSDAVKSGTPDGNVKDVKASPSALVGELEKDKSNKKMDIDDPVKAGEGEGAPDASVGLEEKEIDLQDDPEEEEGDPEEGLEEEDVEEEPDDENVMEEDPEEEYVDEEEEEEDAPAENGASDKVVEGTGGSKDEGEDEDEEEEEKSSSSMKSVRGEEYKPEKVKKTESEGEKGKKDVVPTVPVDKEVLQAFRFFDRNRVGYIRVDDMRAILHNLGMFLSHREVKELVQGALLESNTGRDDRILYSKLLKFVV